ncbi:hypothetical protein [Microbacterium sp. W4I4]|uniref:hypothetical protein n=1 Tax=Microbacterium sp. W4I4 TaxID=3042295 RepID=UPI0027D8C863|nr:hypothetical protein [Microbacterium sp. W4I4]
MYTITAAESSTSGQIWSALLAMRQLDAAEDALMGAAALAGALSAESQWRNEGVSARTLREALDELHAAIAHELSEVRGAHAEVERGISA